MVLLEPRIPILKEKPGRNSLPENQLKNLIDIGWRRLKNKKFSKSEGLRKCYRRAFLEADSNVIGIVWKSLIGWVFGFRIG